MYSILLVLVPFITIGLLRLVAPAVGWFTDQTLLYLKEEDFKEIVQLAEAGSFERDRTYFQTYQGTTFKLDAGPPVRVAFLVPTLDRNGWYSVVFDPTGLVGQAKGYISKTDSFEVPSSVANLFSGYLIGCTKINADFHWCSFLDEPLARP